MLPSQAVGAEMAPQTSRPKLVGVLAAESRAALHLPRLDAYWSGRLSPDSESQVMTAHEDAWKIASAAEVTRELRLFERSGAESARSGLPGDSHTNIPPRYCYSPPVADAYLRGCPASVGCASFAAQREAQAVCDAATDCGGLTRSAAGAFELRGPELLRSPTNELAFPRRPCGTA